ncbi:MAG: hypothetical protein J0I41_06790 [Filimonas sp.]|nr:hypothetical protein [Filimonas sp.]
MKRILLILSLAALVSLNSCKDKTKDNNTNNTTTTSGDVAKDQPKATGNAPLSYAITYSPDSAILGTSREAFVKFTGGETIALQDPDGKATGMQATFGLSITNKSTLDKSVYFGLMASEARIELDNSTSIPLSKEEGDVNPAPESTTQATWKATFPANTKPVKLNLFLNGTRVSVGLTLTEKK